MSEKIVAITGTAAPTTLLANQEPLFVEVWGVGGTYRTLHRVDRWYEMHTRLDIERAYKEHYAEYLAFLRSLEVPCMMHEAWPDIPTSKTYPLAERVEKFGRVLSSTIAYMIADAIAEGYNTIKLFGVNMMHDSEYGSQHAGCAYLIGWAKAVGIQVVVPDASPLLKYPLYGVTETEDADFVMRMQALDEEEKQVVARLAAIEGRKAETQHWRKWFGDRTQGQALARSMNGKVTDGAVAQAKHRD